MTSVCYDIFRDLERESISNDGGKIYLLTNPDVERVLKEEERYSVMELEKRINRRIVIIPKGDFHIEQYEISIH